MITETERNELARLYERQGYFYSRRMVDGSVNAVAPFLFTVGLIVNLGPYDYERRYCYQYRTDALEDLKNWNGEGHPPGPWIKMKGRGGDRTREELE